jgi:endonuclease/exonuclease/phosphatase family metal-dependent hydrolase
MPRPSAFGPLAPSPQDQSGSSLRLRLRLHLYILFGLTACGSDAGLPLPQAIPDGGITLDAGTDAAGGATDSSAPKDARVDVARRDSGPPRESQCEAGREVLLRIAAGNISSGTKQSYDEGSGARILTALMPDIALLQEFNFGTGSDAEIQGFVSTALGASYTYARGPGGQIPNGVVSRFPILESGSWEDPQVANRSFVWAHIDIPGPVDLWAVSVHLLTTGGGARQLEAEALTTQLQAQVPAGDYLVIGGDFNTDSRPEGLMQSLGMRVSFDPPYPDDGTGNTNTSRPRSKPYDWVVVSPNLLPKQVPVVLAGESFAAGLVFDTRVFPNLAVLMPPLMGNESTAPNMQHMPVVKDFVAACE